MFIMRPAIGTEPSAAAPGGRRNLAWLTALRGIAAWWVVLFHLRDYVRGYIPAWLHEGFAYGNLAVDFFFLLSGFVIYLSYADRMGGPGAVRDFLFARFARLYPLHLLILLGFSVYAALAIAAGPSSVADHRPGYWLASLLLVQNWGFTDSLAWNVPAWSISTEAFAYLMFPALLFLLHPGKRGTAALVAGLILLSAALHLYLAAFGSAYPGAIAETGLLRCVVQFAMGMLVCETWLRLAPRLAAALPLLAAGAVLLAAYLAAGAPVLPLAWAAMVLGLALLPRQAPPPALVWLGDVSYATYLSHFFILTLFKFAFVGADGGLTPLQAALYLAIVLAASAALYHGFERPAQRGLMAWRRRRRAVSGTPVAA